MEDLVAVELTTAGGPRCYFVTWGRIQDGVDAAPLAALILDVADRFAIRGAPVSARVCDSLHAARDAPLFFEALFDFAQRPIPYGSGYEKWRRRMDQLMREGMEIFAVGPFKSS